MNGILKRARQSGFTLIELMVVIVIVGILASMGLPYFQKQILKGQLEEALPYMQQIAAKERIYKVRNGSYLAESTNYTSTAGGYLAYDEDNLEATLGVDLKGAANFCFIVVTGATNTLTESSPATPAIDFEVWAVTRNTSYNSTNEQDTVPTPGSMTCRTAGDGTGNGEKDPPTGWVPSSGAGSEGRVVILRYPPPANGISSDNAYVWTSGITFSNALAD